MEDSESKLRFFYESEKLGPNFSERNKPIGGKIFDLYENPAEKLQIKINLCYILKKK